MQGLRQRAWPKHCRADERSVLCPLGISAVCVRRDAADNGLRPHPPYEFTNLEGQAIPEFPFTPISLGKLSWRGLMIFLSRK